MCVLTKNNLVFQSKNAYSAIMQKKEPRLAVRCFAGIIRFRYVILIVTLCITAYMINNCGDLRISADYSFVTDDIEPTVFVETSTAINQMKATTALGGESFSNTTDPLDLAISPLLLQNMYATTVPAYLEEDEKPIKNPNANYGDGFAIVITSENLFTPEMLSRISKLMRDMDYYPIVGPCVSPFNFVTLEKKGTRLAIVPMSPHIGYGEWTQEEADIFYERLYNDDIAGDYLYNQDTNTVLLYYRIEFASNQQLAEMRSFLQPLRDAGCTVAVTGYSTITERIMHYLNKDLFTLLSLCILVILVVYFFSFRSIRGVFIPFSVSVIGIIWTLGTMAKIGYSLSLVTLLTPCLVLILGSSYSIHMLNEYYAECRESLASPPDTVCQSSSKILKTILLASLTTIIGFLSLTFARTSAFREFGISIAIGVSYCAVLSLTYLPALLSLMRRPKQKTLASVSHDQLSKLIQKVAQVSKKRSIIVVIIISCLAGLFGVIHSKVAYDSNYMSYFPSNDTLIQENVYFAQTMGGTDPYYLTIKAPNDETGYFLRPDVLSKVFAYEMKIQKECPDIVHVLSFPQYIAFINKVYSGSFEIPDSQAMVNMFIRILTMLKNQIGSDVLDVLINENATEITLSMRNYDSVEQDLQTTASAKRIADTLDIYRYMLPEGTSSMIWCFAYDLARGNDRVMEDQQLTTYISIIAVFIIACIVFRSLVFGIGALLPVLCGIMGNYIFMWAMGMSFDLVTVGFSSVTVGIGIDDALHFIIRYRLLRQKHPELACSKALDMTITQTGRPIILTTLSVVIGMMMFCFASYAPIKYFGLVMSVALASTMLATLSLLPAYLQFVDWLKVKWKLR